ncbi:unnamed protein product [Linum tenue]|uniref:Glutamyl-tRNA(Gln) amidotransferase subunit C, chloroplastic/mitochondrial n=1 Tax=Linum tenue TaxID=586396 RepID=A0AAV0P0Y0_9ROSI|nr:unnamed protein product [Linum tenue]
MATRGLLLGRSFPLLLIHSSKTVKLTHGYGRRSSYSFLGESCSPCWRQNSAARFSAKALSNEEAPDVRRLAQTARISLTEQEVEDFGPKIQQVIEWFGQLQGVDLKQVEPGIRAATAAGKCFFPLSKVLDEAEEGVNLRDDVPVTFPKADAIIEGLPSYDAPYVRVPKFLHKED